MLGADQDAEVRADEEQDSFEDVIAAISQNSKVRRNESALEARDQPKFGILLMAPKDIYFVEERPNNWVDLEKDALSY